jgi:hypothetical protein
MRYNNSAVDKSKTTTTMASSTSSENSNAHDHVRRTTNLPLYIGTGWGTTGTRSMHNACCKLGIPSLHWDKYCPPPPSSSNNNNNNNNSSDNNDIEQIILNTTNALWKQ